LKRWFHAPQGAAGERTPQSGRLPDRFGKMLRP
jgi:hypothetical protein